MGAWGPGVRGRRGGERRQAAASRQVPVRRSVAWTTRSRKPRQGCTKLWVGPRAAPARSAQQHAKVFEKRERPGTVEAIASQAGSRFGELDAALRPRESGARWVDRVGADGLTEGRETILSSGSRGTDHLRHIHVQ